MINFARKGGTIIDSAAATISEIAETEVVSPSLGVAATAATILGTAQHDNQPTADSSSFYQLHLHNNNHFYYTSRK